MTRRALALGIGGSLVIALPAIGVAAERHPWVEFSMSGSVPLQYTDNAVHSSQKQSDVYLAPYLQAMASGNLNPNIGYSLYASAGVDHYRRLENNDGALATLGGHLFRRWDRFHLGATYEHNYAYDGPFREKLYISDDVALFARYHYVSPSKSLKIKPRLSIGYRAADDPSVQRWITTARIEFEQKLIERWWWIVTPRVRLYHYTTGDNANRRDILGSISTGLKYDINSDVSLSTNLGYENRTSNVDGKGFNAFTAGVSLDFSHTFDRLR